VNIVESMERVKSVDLQFVWWVSIRSGLPVVYNHGNFSLRFPRTWCNTSAISATSFCNEDDRVGLCRAVCGRRTN